MNVALRPDSINLISLCTGGGGLDLGVELAMPSARSVVLVEREAFSASQLVSAIQQGLMAEAAIWSDVATFNGRPWRGLVDGLIGGIPCQPHSLAGKRQGSEDERDLWSDARRIIVQSGAWFVLIENVSGMLSAKPGLDPGALRVRRDLQRLGFDVEGGLFTAAEVGASHERERVFILAVADARCSEWRPLAWAGRIANGYEAGRIKGTGRIAEPSAGLADASSARLEIGQQSEIQRGNIWHERAAVATSRPGMVDPSRERCREGWPEPEFRGGRSPAAFTGGLFPPGPSDLSGWRHTLERAPELEPAFRRVADGLASWLDIARVDRLRMLGNGVVPLEAAYAFRTLATRLAASGSASATRLVRMMKIPATETLEAAE